MFQTYGPRANPYADSAWKQGEGVWEWAVHVNGFPKSEANGELWILDGGEAQQFGDSVASLSISSKKTNKDTQPKKTLNKPKPLAKNEFSPRLLMFQPWVSSLSSKANEWQLTRTCNKSKGIPVPCLWVSPKHYSLSTDTVHCTIFNTHCLLAVWGKAWWFCDPLCKRRLFQGFAELKHKILSPSVASGVWVIWCCRETKQSQGVDLEWEPVPLAS